MKRIVLALALLLAPSLAFAQCTGVFPNNTVCGNATGSSAPPKATTSASFPSSLIVGTTPISSGTNTYLLFNNSGILGNEQFAPLANGGLGGSQAAATAGQIPIFPGSGGAAVPTSFLQSGTGAVARTWNNKVKETSISITDFGAVAPGTAATNSAAVQSAINAVLTAGGGSIYIPAASSCYNVSTGILIDTSALTTQYSARIRLYGDGVNSCLKNTTNVNLLTYKGAGATAGAGAYFYIDNIRLQGASQVGGGLYMFNEVAYARLTGVVINGFNYGMYATDVEQLGVFKSEFNNNNEGIIATVFSCCTSASTWNFFDSTIINNKIWGLDFTFPNNIAFYGGSIQSNGSAGGCAGVTGTGGGALFVDAGAGGSYGTVSFRDTIFEGNCGLADLYSQQSTAGTQINMTLDGVSFIRPSSSAYALNNLNVFGTVGSSNYKIINSNFLGANTYAASAGRPAIAINNTNARVEIDGLSKFWSTIESPTQGIQYLGTAGVFSGLQNIAGSASGVITTQPQAAAGTYNWNWPTTAGAAGALFYSGGGGSTATNWLADVAVGSILTSGGVGTAPAYSAAPNIATSLMVGHATQAVVGTFTVHAGVNRNQFVTIPVSSTAGIAFGSINDANSAYQPFEIRASLLQLGGNSAGGTSHISTLGAGTPALTSCGTGSPAISGTDTAGEVTMGTSATGCIVTFNNAYAAAPYCVVTWQATPLAAQSYSTSTTAITIVQTSTSGNKLNYLCIGQTGG